MPLFLIILKFIVSFICFVCYFYFQMFPKNSAVTQPDASVPVVKSVLPSSVSDFEGISLIKKSQAFFRTAVTAYLQVSGSNYLDLRLTSRSFNAPPPPCVHPHRDTQTEKTTVSTATPISDGVTASTQTPTTPQLRNFFQAHCSSEKLIIAALNPFGNKTTGIELALSEDDRCSLSKVDRANKLYKTDLFVAEIGADRCGTKQSVRKRKVVMKNKVRRVQCLWSLVQKSCSLFLNSVPRLDWLFEFDRKEKW